MLDRPTMIALAVVLTVVAIGIVYATRCACTKKESLGPTAGHLSCDAMLEHHLRNSPTHLVSGALLDVANIDPKDISRVFDALRRKGLITPVAEDNRRIFSKLSALVVEAIDAMSERDVELLNTAALFKATFNDDERETREETRRAFRRLEPVGMQAMGIAMGASLVRNHMDAEERRWRQMKPPVVMEPSTEGPRPYPKVSTAPAPPPAGPTIPEALTAYGRT